MSDLGLSDPKGNYAATSPSASRTALKAEAEDTHHPHLAYPLQPRPAPGGPSADRIQRVKIGRRYGGQHSEPIDMQRPAEGMPDYIVLLAGPSLMITNKQPVRMRYPERGNGRSVRPIVIMAARSGLYTTEVDQAMAQAWEHYPMISTGVPDVGGK